MEIIEYQGFKNLFAAYARESEQDFIIYGKTSPVSIEQVADYTDSYDGRKDNVCRIMTGQTIKFSVSFLPVQDIAIHMESIQNKKEYEHIIEILKAII